MKILICNERFLFRFGVDRVLLMLGTFWKKAGHEVIMMGNKLDPMAVNKCSDRFIHIPEAPDYLYGNDYTAEYIEQNWDTWFDCVSKPDIVLVAGWPFYNSIRFLREKCGSAIFHDYGAVPTDGMNEAQIITQNMLRSLRKENLKYANKVIAISRFLEETQSKIDVEGLIPTSYVHLGIDHLNMHLWDKEELKIDQKDVISDIEKFKKEGYKIIFQPGRWENGNYKNSAESFNIIRKVSACGNKVKVLVLSTPTEIGEIPDDLRDNYYCMGFIDDSTMRRAMELSDLGISPTLWEGFDLPLGEMQFLSKCMYVFNIGAHPEVVADKYFLCENSEEMAEKICKHFQQQLPYGDNEIRKLHTDFRDQFTWKNCADKLLHEMEGVVLNNTVLFIDVTNACHDSANSGVMRVTRKLSHFLQKRMNTIFLLWDDSINNYVLPYNAEVELLCSYGGPNEEQIVFRSKEGHMRTLLDDVLGNFHGKRKIHMFTETVNYKIMQRATRYFHNIDVPVAAVFYDAIPVLRPELCSEEVSENHKKYMLELAGCDLVIPIAEHNQRDLEAYWREKNVKETYVKTIPLAAEMDGVERYEEKIRTVPEMKKILFVSTLEPRKNHIRFLKAYDMLISEHPELRETTKVTLVGNRYAGNSEIPTFVEAFTAKHNNVEWLGVVDDQTLKDLYEECTLTVYPSEIEGFGMPIIESLWFGKPCVCNEVGSIGELATQGGCLTTNVFDVCSIKEALYKILTDASLYIKLQNDAVERNITTWQEYTNAICLLLENVRVETSNYRTNTLSLEVKTQIEEHFKNAIGKKILIISNYYPPNFIGGAEIIAHNQAITLQKYGFATVMAVALDVSGRYSLGETYLDKVDGIHVLRIAVPGENFDSRGINFFDPTINTIFEEICELIKPDIAHCHNLIGMSLGIIDVVKKYGAKVCVTLHDNWGFCYKNTILDNKGELCANVFSCEKCLPALTAEDMYIPIGVRKSYFRRTLEKVDAFISPSQYLANSYLRAGFNYHKMHVLWNGIDTARFVGVKKISSEKIRITYVGYFGKHKGIELLIKAVSMLKNKNIEINLIGAGEEQDNYKKLAAENGCLHQLRFWGKIANQDIGNAYAETDIYCLPSIWPENQPVSITEAMACGIPVIASDLGGNRELVKDGKTGFLFKAGDEEDLMNKIKCFIDDRSLVERFGSAGKKIMMENGYHNQVMKLNEIYEDLPEEKFTSSKPLIIFKGERVPENLDKLTSCDLIKSEWILEKKEFDRAKAFIVFDEQLSKDEENALKHNKVKLVVKDNLYLKYKAEGFDVINYSGYERLLEIISSF